MALQQLPAQWKQQLQPFRSSLFPHTSVPSSNLLSCSVAGLLPPTPSSSSSSPPPQHLHIPSIADDILTAMLAAAPSSSHQGSDIILPVQSAQKRPFAAAFPESSNEIADEDGSTGDDSNTAQQEEKKGRRLSNEQVRALEKAFDEDLKLEPERKAKLAKELGLQQRQVAIWFQNRRARWKTKQTEREYSSLKQKFESMKAQRDGLLHEKQKLQAEVARLKKALENNSPPLPSSPSCNENAFCKQCVEVISPSCAEQNESSAAPIPHDNNSNSSNNNNNNNNNNSNNNSSNNGTHSVEGVQSPQAIEGNGVFDLGDLLANPTSLLDLSYLLYNKDNFELEAPTQKLTMGSYKEGLDHGRNDWFIGNDEWWD